MYSKVLGLITFAVIICISNGLEISCIFKRDPTNDCYTCYGRITNPRRPEALRSVSGQHLPNHRNRNVKCFNIEGQREFSQFPHFVGRYFGNLESINARGTGISAITRSQLHGLRRIDRNRIYLGPIPTLFSSTTNQPTTPDFTSTVTTTEELSTSSPMTTSNFPSSTTLKTTEWPTNPTPTVQPTIITTTESNSDFSVSPSSPPVTPPFEPTTTNVE